MRRVTMHRPRLLPATIAVMALLLVVKVAALSWEALGGGGTGSAELVSEAAAADQDSGTRSQEPEAKTPPVSKPDAPATADDAKPQGNAPPAAAPQPPPVSDAERQVLLDLRHRRETLDARSRDIDQRGAVLAAAEAKLSARVSELNALQARLEQLDGARRAHDEANWTGLVHVYETMKPREAAQIFDSLDMQVLLAVLDRMQPRRAAPVLAAMQPDRARLATQMLAELRTKSVTVPKG